MFIEPTITWVPSGSSGYIWLDTKIVFIKKNELEQEQSFSVVTRGCRLADAKHREKLNPIHTNRT